MILKDIINFDDVGIVVNFPKLYHDTFTCDIEYSIVKSNLINFISILTLYIKRTCIRNIFWNFK